MKSSSTTTPTPPGFSKSRRKGSSANLSRFQNAPRPKAGRPCLSSLGATRRRTSRPRSRPSRAPPRPTHGARSASSRLATTLLRVSRCGRPARPSSKPKNQNAQRGARAGPAALRQSPRRGSSRRRRGSPAKRPRWRTSCSSRGTLPWTACASQGGGCASRRASTTPPRWTRAGARCGAASSPSRLEWKTSRDWSSVTCEERRGARGARRRRAPKRPRPLPSFRRCAPMRRRRRRVTLTSNALFRPRGTRILLKAPRATARPPRRARRICWRLWNRLKRACL
mmetsp:Transcript_2920/g.10335  ORF Transcript_2920/g.10335 Transcript_2920/m.10335 type:complete len:282 (+) Transcript_2920:792-1637(+)